MSDKVLKDKRYYLLIITLVIIFLFNSQFIPLTIEDTPNISHEIESVEEQLFSESAVNKTLYLRDDGSYDIEDPTDLMNTTKPMIWRNMGEGAPDGGDFDEDSEPGLTINQGFDPNHPNAEEQYNLYQDFELTPPLSDNFTIHGDVSVGLYIENGGNPEIEEINITLFEMIDEEKNYISSFQTTFGPLNDQEYDFEEYKFAFPSINYTLKPKSQLVMRIWVPDVEGNNDLFFAYDSTDRRAFTNIPTTTFIDVHSTEFFDESDKLITSHEFGQEDTVQVRANITNPIGAYDIRHPDGDWHTSGANISVYDLQGNIIHFEEPMEWEATDESIPSYWKSFNFNISSGDLEYLGTYEVEVKAWDGNGINITEVSYFHVLDMEPPTIADISTYPEKKRLNKPVNISCTVTDNIEVNAVWINLTLPDGDHLNETLEADEDIYYLERSFSQIGNHEFIISSNDTSDNWNSSEIHSFEIYPNSLHHISLTPYHNYPEASKIEVGGNSIIFEAVGWNDADETEINETWEPKWNLTSDLGTLKNHSNSPSEAYRIEFVSGNISGYENITITDIKTGVSNKTCIHLTPLELYEMVMVSGDDQKSTRGTRLDEPFVVELRDIHGNPVGEGKEVWFNITTEGLSGDSYLESNSPVATDSKGRASIWLVLDSKAGLNMVTADANVAENATLQFKAEGTVPNMAVSLSVDASRARPGETIYYTIRYINNGTESAKDLWINLTLDPKIDYISDNHGITPDITDKNISWYIKDVPIGHHSFLVTCKIQTDIQEDIDAETVIFLEYTDMNGKKVEVLDPDITTTLIDVGGLIEATDIDWTIFIWVGIVLAALIISLGYNHYKNTLIDDVFLIYENGIMIAHQTRRIRPEMDSDIFSNMLNVIQNFVKDSFKDEENWGIKKLEFGEKKVLIEKGEHISLAVVYSGEFNTFLMKRMQKVMKKIEERYDDVLEKWNGDLDEFRGVKELLKELY